MGLETAGDPLFDAFSLASCSPSRSPALSSFRVRSLKPRKRSSSSLSRSAAFAGPASGVTRAGSSTPCKATPAFTTRPIFGVSASKGDTLGASIGGGLEGIVSSMTGVLCRESGGRTAGAADAVGGLGFVWVDGCVTADGIARYA
ncbi:unnamed protein product [Periconia digitata]|uniref:Uncharacterized protein n=1 Tax=Periconia digitata TaxID=1303443 RepID=A0A9W4U5Z8_9PLEO|nr:unnamed protein product [Periconia digitata]